MNLPFISRRPGLYVRLRHACPRCDSPHVQRLPPVSVHREYEWYECEDCEHLWALRYYPGEAGQQVGRTMIRLSAGVHSGTAARDAAGYD